MRNATFRRQSSHTIQEFEMRRHWKVLALAATALSGWASYAAAPAVERQAHGVTVRFDNGVVRLEVWSDRVVRVTYAKGAEIPAMQSLSVNSAPAAVPFEIKETPSSVDLFTHALRGHVDKSTGLVSFRDLAGKTSFRSEEHTSELQSLRHLV